MKSIRETLQIQKNVNIIAESGIDDTVQFHQLREDQTPRAGKKKGISKKISKNFLGPNN